MCSDDGIERTLRHRRQRLGPSPGDWGRQSLWGTVRRRGRSKSNCYDELEGEGREAEGAGCHTCDQLQRGLQLGRDGENAQPGRVGVKHILEVGGTVTLAQSPKADRVI
jgi:hypothetical protein